MPFLAIVWCRDADAVRTTKAIMDESPDGIKLAGVFSYPGKDAEFCPGASCVPHRRAQGWTRTRRGVMVCGHCMKPHRDSRRRLIGALFDYLGANLMKNAPRAFRTPEGYGPRT